MCYDTWKQAFSLVIYKYHYKADGYRVDHLHKGLHSEMSGKKINDMPESESYSLYYDSNPDVTVTAHSLERKSPEYHLFNKSYQCHGCHSIDRHLQCNLWNTIMGATLTDYCFFQNHSSFTWKLTFFPAGDRIFTKISRN